ncbi:hypothetical protein SAMN02745823_02534 [Sporobacter termitidis DSM 10068]|uniref:Uncharacterized protein n=1 Tax=Sporobacter termitidis DSM 10068 TaxID=1123282 RepID=A0A1M5YHA9_9FIRM|nr:hypothetical protein [Sporobacter termitidis]SHI11386.1 hypothetical protein SAMN02745823_02534 [Sporobacter termitidis DSM 10068]
MHKIKKPLVITAAAVVLVAAAVLGVLSAVKTTPWELTYHLVPSDVTAAMIWRGTYSYQLTEEEIVQLVHYLNRLEKSSFAIKYSRQNIPPQFGLSLQCGGVEIQLNQISSTHGPLVMTFDETTAKSFTTGQWYVNHPETAAYITALLDAKQSEATPTT